jgi:protein-tyrosine phosphatase
MGNICRSPTAEAVMRHLVEERGLSEEIHIESAGTGDWHVGDAADTRARAAGLRRGYRLDRRAQQFRQAFFDRFDYVLAADQENLHTLERLATDGASRNKIRLLRSFDPAAPLGAEVPDPYYGSPDGFDEVLDLCETACRGLLDHIEGELSRR